MLTTIKYQLQREANNSQGYTLQSVSGVIPVMPALLGDIWPGGLFKKLNIFIIRNEYLGFFFQIGTNNISFVRGSKLSFEKT